jgi:hypothetical protein
MKSVNDIIDIWQRRTECVSADIYHRYLLDGNTRGFPALKALEEAFEKVMREVCETKVGDIPAVWCVYNMGFVVKTRRAAFTIDFRIRPKRLVFGHLWELGHDSGRLDAPLIRAALSAARSAGADPDLALWGECLTFAPTLPRAHRQHL